MSRDTRNAQCKIQNANQSWTTRAGFAFCILNLALLATACTTEAEKPPAPPAAVQIGMENVVTVAQGTIVVGPIVSGELRRSARRRFALRSAAPSLRSTFARVRPCAAARCSAVSRRARSTTYVSRRCRPCATPRTSSRWRAARWSAPKQLVKAGAIAARDLDLGAAERDRREAQLADAKSRLARAERQLGDTVLRSPIDGLIAKKPVNIGDVVAVGAELFTVIDPSSMRLEASVPSDDLSHLRVGATVEFTVRGYDQPFEGRIDHDCAAGGFSDPPGADLRVDSERRRPSRGGAVCRRACRAPVGGRAHGADQCRQHAGRRHRGCCA